LLCFFRAKQISESEVVNKTDGVLSLGRGQHFGPALGRAVGAALA
jgi:hypothetical protein